MEKISSRQNKIISHVRRLGSDRAYRRECGEYVCDGEKLLSEAVKWGAKVKAALWCTEPSVSLPDTVRQYAAPQELLDYATALKNCPGVLFTVEPTLWPHAAPGRTLVLETIQDPGNLGTILRTANALGMDTVILTGGCADLYNHKTVRSPMGALFRLPAWSCTLEQLRTLSVRTGLPLLGTALREDTIDLREADLGRSIVLLGSEGRGLSEAALAACCQTIRIPMEAKCESLNVAAAAAAILWEGYRQPCASGGAAHRLRFQAII